MHIVPSIDWGRTAAMVSVGYAIWRALAWVLGLGWGQYVQKAMAPEFALLHKAIRRYRFQTARRLQKIEDRLDRLENKVDVAQR